MLALALVFGAIPRSKIAVRRFGREIGDFSARLVIMSMRKVIFSMLLLGCLVQGGLLAQNGGGASVAGADDGAAMSTDAGVFAGWWNGVLSVAGQNIKMEFEIARQDGKLLGKMNAQGVKGIPVEVAVDGGALTLQVKQLGMKYSGMKMGSSVMGTFEQHGFTAPLILYPGKFPVNRPQTPKGPFPYKVEEVVIENSVEGSRLAGTLTYPVPTGTTSNGAKVPTWTTSKRAKIPVVVMVTGSGTQNRDEEIFEHKPFAVIADWLARNGVATLRYDDRGAGGSAGPLEGITTENNASDARAAVEFIRSQRKFGKVGVLGHSEGGTIAIILAGEGTADFIISMAGVATQGKECIIWQNEAILQLKGAPKQMASDYGKLLNEIYTKRIALYAQDPQKGGAIPQAQQFVRDFCAQEGISLPDNLLANAAAVASSHSLWIDWMVGYDPAETVRKIKCPVMAINGSLDMQVPAKANLDVLRELLPASKKHLIKEYPSLNHLFQSCTEQTSLQYGEIEETISIQVLEDIAKWITTLF